MMVGVKDVVRGGMGGTSVVRNVQGSSGVEGLFSSPRISLEEGRRGKERGTKRERQRQQDENGSTRSLRPEERGL